ncbi:hypothetical protein [Nocardia sp. XZ_19_385]|uniref:hypothetical protein n=1 Tax=Nocardia sp. XZ_19_385 TaxID=2769488 RepID=UPI0018908F19|nr:hypothetical protein [Nocardia sp. XZ_19_385]
MTATRPRLKPMRNTALGAVATVAALAFATLFATPAHAHATSTFHGQDKAWINVTHADIWVSDGECDANHVYAQFDTDFTRDRKVHANGCRGESGHSHQGVVDRIIRFRVCEASVGCSPYKNA